MCVFCQNHWTICQWRVKHYMTTTFHAVDLLLWLLVILSDFIVASLTRVKYSTRNVRWWSKNSSLSFWLDKRTSSTDCVTVLKNPLSFSLLFLPRTLSWDSIHNNTTSPMTTLTSCCSTDTKRSHCCCHLMNNSGSCQIFPILLNGPGYVPRQKTAPSLGVRAPKVSPNVWFLGHTWVNTPTSISTGSAILCAAVTGY